ncbi:hypothetical protein [Myxococcus stipitatus]|uniref:hypothetical protein n=1 Tax=Myxococcus stipitatus TaxID=83455 RepID=UPI0030D5ECFF
MATVIGLNDGMATPWSQGVPKNLVIVALCLLVGGAAAFALREPRAPGALPVAPVVSDGGTGVPTGGPEVPTGGPEVPIRDGKKARLTGAYVDPRRPRRMPPGPEMRHGTADVWCEGLSLERCGKYPQDCEVGVYCDGVRFCRSQPRFPSPETCAGEGILGANVACCSGLVARCGIPEGGRGTCNPQQGDESEPVCIRCGDGMCGPFEQACNCPEDCAPSEARPKLRYRGLRPEGPEDFALDASAAPAQCLDTQPSPGAVHNCLVAWSESLFGLRTVAELERAEDLKPFTPFDLDLMRCLERSSSYAYRRSETSREGCIEALYRRTRDSRLDKLRWFSTLSGGAR